LTQYTKYNSYTWLYKTVPRHSFVEFSALLVLFKDLFIFDGITAGIYSEYKCPFVMAKHILKCQTEEMQIYKMWKINIQ
jgi:hypothetical protein